MLKRWIFLGVGLACLWAASLGNAQRATEVYIPIGKSPGLSGRYTSMGTIDAVDRQAMTLTVADGSRTQVIECTDDTKFWLDRSKRSLTNREGSLADCRPGSRVEVKYVGNERQNAVAEWVKIEVMASN